MSDLEHFLAYALEYEVNHQLILSRLLRHAPVATALVGIETVKDVKWEPRGGLFDLAIHGAKGTVYVEIKAGYGSLQSEQLSRQRAFLQAPQDDGTPAKAVYVLFGYSTFEYTARSLKEDLDGVEVDLLSYSNVPAKLERAESELPPDEAALSKAYRSTLARHWSFLANTDGLEVRRLRRYDQIRSALPSLDVRIYRTANASGTVVILNDQNWQRVDVDGQPAYVYQEVNNDRLCIKLAAEDLPTGTKRLLRDTLREAAEHVLGETAPDLVLTRSGRLGNYMTAIVVGDEDIASIPPADAARRVRMVHDALPAIAGRIRVNVVQRAV